METLTIVALGGLALSSAGLAAAIYFGRAPKDRPPVPDDDAEADGEQHPKRSDPR